MVADQALVADDLRTPENREGEAWEPTHMGLVGSQTRSGVGGIVVRKFDRRELFFLVVLGLVDDHCQHLSAISCGLHVPPYRCCYGGRSW